MDGLKRGGGWVKLNIGGKVFSTTRATLCRVPDTMLSRMFRYAPLDIRAMFSKRIVKLHSLCGRDDAPMEPSYLDESGAYMLDLDPNSFAPILNYLRFDKLIIDAEVSPLGVLETARFLNFTVCI